MAYFVVGGIFMYTQRGARGLEVIPNYSFWKDFPFLIKVTTTATASYCIYSIMFFLSAGWVFLHNQSLLQERQISRTLAVCVAVCSKVHDGYAEILFPFFSVRWFL